MVAPGQCPVINLKIKKMHTSVTFQGWRILTADALNSEAVVGKQRCLKDFDHPVLTILSRYLRGRPSVMRDRWSGERDARGVKQGIPALRSEQDIKSGLMKLHPHYLVVIAFHQSIRININIKSDLLKGAIDESLSNHQELFASGCRHTKAAECTEFMIGRCLYSV